MKRRAFFGHLATVIAAAAAPTVFIPHTPVKWGKPLLYVPKIRKLKAVWSVELEQDLRAFYGISVEKEMAALYTEYAKQEIPDREIMSVSKSEEVVYHPLFFTPQHHVIALVKEPVI